MESFNRSLSFDIRLYEEDITGSTAYAQVLHKAGIIKKEEMTIITKALRGIREDIERGNIRFLKQDEDVHMAVERVLIERTGEAGAKLHTGRSRNDQVATDIRLYVMKSVRRICSALTGLQIVLLEQAQKHQKTCMPGYTHLQQAQPITLAHYFLSLFFALQRDLERFAGVYDTTDIMPLGSGALAGSGFNLDRKFLAKKLGFSRISENSLDAVSDRDFIIEFLSAASIVMMHLSRYAEDLIIWSSQEFGFVELDDSFSTGSSMMPQKKNPDSLELIRGKTGRIYGNLVCLLTVMKGLPLSYGKDMQEDKEPLFDTADTLAMVVPVMSGVIKSAAFNVKKMKSALSDSLLSTDIADHLTRKGIPFRSAHKIVGKLSRYCYDRKKPFSKLTAKELKKFSDSLNITFIKKLSFEQSLKNRNIAGGTGYNSVKNQIRTAKKILSDRRLA